MVEKPKPKLRDREDRSNSEPIDRQSSYPPANKAFTSFNLITRSRPHHCDYQNKHPTNNSAHHCTVKRPKRQSRNKQNSITR
nr:MAG: hypothetical protein AmFV_00202 [Apis mellifera filamentous virus]